MTSKEIESKILEIFNAFDKESFIYEFLLAYGVSKTAITRLKKGDYNLSKNEGELLFKNKVFYKEYNGSLLSEIDLASKELSILKHNPRFIIITDYDTFLAKDLKINRNLDIKIQELPNYFDFFLPLSGSEIYKSSNDNKADREAAYKMAQLYDTIINDNPNIYISEEKIHQLNIFLSRILFCFFAEDTNIFREESVFTSTLVQHTLEDGSNTNGFLNELFSRLNDKDDSKYPNYLSKFPYVNGGLFGSAIESPIFTYKSRKILTELGDLDWRDINPDIFGSMIQAVVMPEYRSDLGMHYTSVPNILKLIKPLFLDELYNEYEKYKDNVPQLRKLINRISKIKFFDPACGSGNFLIITYKEIRNLEIQILKNIIDNSPNPQFEFTQIQLTQFYGIELDDFAHEMAILSLWLAEHQMNIYFEEQLFSYGKSKPILPLKEAGKITHANATRIDWKEVCPIVSNNEEIYIMGNPPYLGSRNQNEEQKEDLKVVFNTDYKSLDYIAAWFYKGSKYIKGNNAKCAFVSTNSICQGLLVGLTWSRILDEAIEIDYAYQSFKWTNNAKGSAGVTVIILGLRNISSQPKYLYNDNLVKEVKNINPYLADATNIVVESKNKPISKFPLMNFGNMPADGGLLLFDELEKIEFLKTEPHAENWIKPLISAHEFLNGQKRYCLWLEDISEEELNNIPLVKERVNKVHNIRLASSRPQLAKTPHLFAQITQPPNRNFILIPRHSSEDRMYIPIGFFDSNNIAHDSNLIIATDEPWLFAVLTSRMHMAWVRAVGGKLEERLRYSAKLCYNTFPFPDISIKQKELLNQYVFDVLDARAQYPEKTLAFLYNPETMPAILKEAHQALDLAVEKCYTLKVFNTDAERLEHLFKMYEEYTTKNTLFAKHPKKRTSKKTK
ncbi:class I SAM-dependent DNA methyltransferase [Elizabethkingia anophelis]|uniref:class I SAM-dependent DNA methyltransferase n=1 Tax=Elizabethkingia anophelis TaxID=1117645 RepID=UPI0021A2EE48|nr:class I SAM-dependent DNA methyltransferase [Elizabethkingia anophelis]MCT4193875.1 class I SAM-dependent DNA methyltransferase [Elizabethkingia anophelis]